MTLWASNLEDAFTNMLSGEGDVTGAEKLEKVSKFFWSNECAELKRMLNNKSLCLYFRQIYQDNFVGEVLHADGDKVIRKMASQISDIFEKNVAALKVSLSDW